MAGTDSPQTNSPGDDMDPVNELAALQDFLLYGESSANPAKMARKLSMAELEAILAEKRQAAGLAHPTPQRTELQSARKGSRKETSPGGNTGRGRAAAEAGPVNELIEDVPTARFTPARLVEQKAPAEPVRDSRLRNVLGYTLETVVIGAAILLFGNWALQQVGVAIKLPGVGAVQDFAVLPSRSEGIFLSANASGVIRLPATATPRPVTPTPGVTATSAVFPVQTAPPVTVPIVPVASLPPPTTAVAVAVAPTPTPAIVQPIVQSVAEGAPTPTPPVRPPRRLQIPRLGLDTPVLEVTVNLGNWQVADNAAGHHLGTAMPGQAGNMVLAGHRDIRGSIFLKLNELQRGDEFKVVTDAAIYRYVVTEISEVLPNEISVMAPTFEPTATLITCTPIGLATRRLVVKARFEK